MQKTISPVSPSVQANYLSEFVAQYSDRTKTSKQIAQTHRATLADNRVSANFNLALKEICYPIVANKSLGSKIWDADGNEYIDVVMGFGVNLFGHNPPFIKAALIEQLDKGIHLGVQTELAGEVAQLITEMTGMERVAFSNTGTEAIMSAIRIARATTKRNKVAIFSGSYHGHFDGTLVKNKEINGNLTTVTIDSGTPPKFAEDVLVLDYGNLRSLDIIEANKNELAAILVEPVQSSRIDFQQREFLHQLRQITTQLDIALIFDEMVSGFRIHPGGAQAWFNVSADIATYGKIVGGGMPIGVIAGKAKYMDKIDGGMWKYGDDSYPQIEQTFFAGTHCKHPLSLAAARVVLQHLKAQGATLQTQLNQRTTQFIQTLNIYFEAGKIPIKMINFRSLFGSAGSESSNNSGDSSSLGLNLLSYHLTHQGVLSRGGSGFLSTAHTDEDINCIVLAVQDSINNLRLGGLL